VNIRRSLAQEIPPAPFSEKEGILSVQQKMASRSKSSIPETRS